MKYILSTITLVLAIVGFSTVSYAQAPKTTPVATPPALFDADTTAPLGVRKQFVEGNLRDLYTRFNALYTRVQVASIRLGTNGINTAKSNEALGTAQAALVHAKASIDAFALTPVDEKPATVIVLRTHAKAAEDSLRAARAGIIGSITALQLTLQAQ